MTSAVFKLGTFVTFEAKRDFKIADPTDTSPTGSTLTINRGDILEFDGTHLKWGDQNYRYPQLKGAVKAGWIVSEDFATDLELKETAVVAEDGGSHTFVRMGADGKKETVASADADRAFKARRIKTKAIQDIVVS